MAQQRLGHGRPADVARADDKDHRLTVPRTPESGGPTIRRVSQPAERPPGFTPEITSESRPAPGGVDPVPAASVILLRDGAQGLEVLMLRRTSKASFGPGAWVFPGGRIDPGDGADPTSMEAARQGAARETMEEAGRRRRSHVARPVLALVPAAGEPEAFPHLAVRGRGPRWPTR